MCMSKKNINANKQRMKENSNEPKPSGILAGWTKALSKSIASKLNQRINPMPTQTKKKGFLALGVLMGMICFMVVLQSVQSEDTNKALSIDSITTIKDLFSDQYKSENEVMEEYNRMVRYKELFDQLKSHPSGKLILDSLEKVRPGLRDSVKSFSENYYSN
jgi:hypothetical protein